MCWHGGIRALPFDGFYAGFEKYRDYLDSSRPTAVNLHAMLTRMDRVALANREKPVPEILERLRSEALAIHREDMDMCRAISEYGLELVEDGFGVLTHCNAGPLATSRYGTGLGTLFLGAERGMTFHAYCDETRPLLQGARLTTYELQRAGIDCTLICDNMASLVMRRGEDRRCFVGCDGWPPKATRQQDRHRTWPSWPGTRHPVLCVLPSHHRFRCRDRGRHRIESGTGGDQGKFFTRPTALRR
jgi:methylthioribose-1-phosphate isomerase